MIENGDVHRFTHQCQTSRDALVRRARAGVTARVIMGEDEALAAMPRRVDDNLADRQFGAVGTAVAPHQVQAASIVIDMRDPKMLLRGVSLGNATREEAARLLQSVDTQRGFGTLMEHGPDLCERADSSDLNLVRNSHPFWRKLHGDA